MTTTGNIGHDPRGMLEQLSGKHILVLNWRDVRHPQAGGAEQYMHQIALRWVMAGARVTCFAGRPRGSADREVIDGIEVLRAGGPLSLYPHTAMRLLRRRFRTVDHVVDCQNGIPFFSPLFLPSRAQIIQIVHHVHQDQFATRFGPALAAVGRFLEGSAARRIYGERPIAAVSPSTRHELRRRLGFRGPIFIVPNGTAPVPTVRAPRDPDPTITVVSRLVPHKRIDLLLEQLVETLLAVPQVRVEIVGDGPELPRLRRLADDLGLGSVVAFHGYQPDEVRDKLLSRAWLTATTSAAEGWGCSVIEAAAMGVPTVAIKVPGIRDSVVDGRTGWLVDDETTVGVMMARALHELTEEGRAGEITNACQAWARCFTWDRSAELLAGVLLDPPPSATARTARTDMATVARFDRPTGWTGRSLRVTDHVVTHGDQVSLLLHGCDEFDAAAVLRRLDIQKADVRLADRHDLLAGPAGRATSTRQEPLEQSRS
jgi:glycosyltransferase involved in cell wall biosynthesis